MRETDICGNLLPISATLLLFVGAVLILAGFVVMIVFGHRLQGFSANLYEILMTGGGVLVMRGSWISRQWYKGLKSRMT